MVSIYSFTSAFESIPSKTSIAFTFIVANSVTAGSVIMTLIDTKQAFIDV